MKPLPITLGMVVARCPANWAINRLTATIAHEIPERLDVWGMAVAVYRINGSPYGNLAHGVQRFLDERRG